MRKFFYLSFSCFFTVGSVYAANESVRNLSAPPAFPEDLSLPELIRQEQRLKDLKQQLDTQTNIKPKTHNLVKQTSLIIDETPCFDIQRIVLDVEDLNPNAKNAFQFLIKRLYLKQMAAPWY